jgi:hypothetical protein
MALNGTYNTQDYISYKSFADNVAKQYGIPKDLFSALIADESGWNQSARGGQGEIGLMQVKPSTAISIGNPDIYTAQGNIEAGAKYLRQVYDKNKTEGASDYVNWFNAVKAYKGAKSNLEHVQLVMKDSGMMDTESGMSESDFWSKFFKGGNNKTVEINSDGSTTDITDRAKSQSNGLKNLDKLSSDLKGNLLLLFLFLIAFIIAVTSIQRAAS